MLDSHKSISIIIQKELSVCRFGDGELRIMRGRDMGFQKPDKLLADRLIAILGSDDPHIAICIPDVFRDNSRLTESAKKHWDDQIYENLYFWNKFTLKNKVYFDTQFTRFYIDLIDKDQFPQKSIELLKQIWQGKDLLVVEGEGSRLGYKNDLFGNVKSIKRILCPPENAFFKYEQILQSALNHANGRLVIIALGMTATVLAYDLAKQGIRALDVGHVDLEYEWYNMKTKTKVPVKNRYTNEVSCKDFDEIVDNDFSSQIIDIIK